MSALEELMSAALGAPEDRKAQALKVLKGEAPATQRPSTGPLLIGMTKAAEYLGVSRPTLWRQVKAGRFEKVELFSGGSYRLRRADLEAYVRNGGIPRTEVRDAN